MGRTRHEADLTRGRKQLRELICLLRRAVVEKGKRWLSFCSFSGVHLGSTHLGFSTFQALLTELQGRQDFDTESLLLIVYACMRLGIRDRRIMEVGTVAVALSGPGPVRDEWAMGWWSAFGPWRLGQK